jgi:hypothetical protein
MRERAHLAAGEQSHVDPSEQAIFRIVRQLLDRVDRLEAEVAELRKGK